MVSFLVLGKIREKITAIGCRNMGRHAQIVPVFASTTLHIVAGIGFPNGRIRYGAVNSAQLEVLHVGSEELADDANVVVLIILVTHTLPNVRIVFFLVEDLLIVSTYKIPSEKTPTKPHLSLHASSREKIWRTGRARMATSVRILIKE